MWLFRKIDFFSLINYFLILVLLTGCDQKSTKDSIGKSTENQQIKQGLIYKVNFEDGTTAALKGESNEETDPGNGKWEVVTNPAEDDPRNNSEKVGKSIVPQGYVRGELSSQRVPTEGQTYIYKWQMYVPNTYFVDAEVKWLMFSQWKTWPCGSHDQNPNDICGKCGIFNDLNVSADSLTFEYRAKPDCYHKSIPMQYCQWNTFVQEMHWTNKQEGHVKLYVNNELVYQRDNMKTLFDNFNPSKCNLYWALGQYTQWSSEVKENQVMYVDNIEIWGKGEDVRLEEVCPDCE